MFGLKKKEPKYELVEDESTRVYLDKEREAAFWSHLADAAQSPYGRYLFNKFVGESFPDFFDGLNPDGIPKDVSCQGLIKWDEKKAGIALPYFVKLVYKEVK